MNLSPAYVIKKSMDAVYRRWKWLRLGQHLGTAGTLFCVAWFLIQFTAWQGILTQPWLFYLLAALLVWFAVLAFFIISFVIIATQAKRPWLANALEKACPGMMDRVATLVFLEERRPSIHMIPIKRKIEEQAVQVLEKEKLASPFSSDRTLLHLGVFALALLGIIVFQYRFSPFAQLLAPPPAPEAAATAKPDSPFELAARDVTETTEKKAWGEVHIVDPGRDVKLSKVDVLPLQIEIATSDPMINPTWMTSINGQPEEPHSLAMASDPNYMVYQPMIYLDELKVTEWDVISYYAKVQTSNLAEYASKMYFIEIRPFREDILKSMEGKDGKGEKGKALSLLNEITALIHQQTEILQQTHLHQQTKYASDEMRLQDSKKLTDAESDLAVATNHFFAEVASEQENSDIGEILNQLTLAEQEMDRAAAALKDDVTVEGKQREQAALADLIASRKAFQKAANNGAFGGGNNPDDDNDPVVTAGESHKAMSQVSEMHDRDKATLQTLQDLTQRQQALTKTPRTDWSKSQADVRNKLNDLIKQNPDLFRGSEPEQAATQQDMSQAMAAMSGDDTWGTERYATRAGESMGDLEKVVSKNHDAQQLAQAYSLKKIIDQSVKQLGQEQAKPGSMSGDEAKTVADTAQKSTGTLKEITDGMNGAGFGPGLQQSLSDQNQEALNQALKQLAEAPDGSSRTSAAGLAQGDLQKVSQAFDQSQPALTKQSRSQDQFKASPGDSLDQASQQLRSLIAAQENQHAPSPADEAKAESEILHNLEAGLIDPQKPGNPDKAQLVAQAEELLKPKNAAPVDPAVLKKLLDQIEAVRIEANDAAGVKPTEPITTFVDPAKLPPAYRDRIRTYFEQLSGQSK